MTNSTTYLVPAEGGGVMLNDAVLGLFNAHNVALCSALALRTQAPFSNSLLVTLPEDQALAAEHAATFQNGWGFGVAGTYLSGLGSIAEFMIAMLSDGLKNAAAQCDRTDPQTAAFATALQNYRHLVQSMIGTCCDVDPDSGSVLLRMQQIHQSLEELAGQADDDDTRLATALREVRNADQVVKLEQQQRALQDQFSDINAQIAKGATTTIAQDIEFGFQFATGFLDGVTPGAVAGAALGVIGEADAIDGFEQQTAALRAQQTQITSQIDALADTIAQDKADAMTLTLVAAQVCIFNRNIKALLAETGGIIEQMLEWKNALELLSEQSAPPSPNFYTNQNTAGMFFWSGLKSRLDRCASVMALSKIDLSMPVPAAASQG